MAEPVSWREMVEPPDISHLVIEDGAPVDGILSEKQMRLLAHCLYASWDGNGRDFEVFANVGLFYGISVPPVVPDVMLSMDVKIKPDLSQKANNTYFIWEFGKAPDIVFEVVSNRVGGEEAKLEKYALARVAYAVIYDPCAYLSPISLRVWQMEGNQFSPIPPETPLGHIGLGLTLWEGEFEGLHAIWLRWTDAEGNLIPTAEETARTAQQHAAFVERKALAQAEAAQQQAEAARQQADTARAERDAMEARARRLEERLRALGATEDL